MTTQKLQPFHLVLSFTEHIHHSSHMAVEENGDTDFGGFQKQILKGLFILFTLLQKA